MSRRNPKVDVYVRKAKQWRPEMEELRKILLDRQLTEELKWGKPCYLSGTGNVVIILPLKKYCALLFCKGALLQDPEGILIRPTENTQAARQMRFTSIREIAAKKSALKACVDEAIQVEKAGLDVVYKKTTDFIIPEELQKKLDQAPAFRAAFSALTPGRQRGYLLYFSAPKQSKTRESRIEKCVQRILLGKGLRDP